MSVERIRSETASRFEYHHQLDQLVKFTGDDDIFNNIGVNKIEIASYAFPAYIWSWREILMNNLMNCIDNWGCPTKYISKSELEYFPDDDKFWSIDYYNDDKQILPKFRCLMCNYVALNFDNFDCHFRGTLHKIMYANYTRENRIKVIEAERCLTDRIGSKDIINLITGYL
jgi:hypothetical protein